MEKEKRARAKQRNREAAKWVEECNKAFEQV
jgi:hypothetical protein